MMTLRDRAVLFRSLHIAGQPLVLPNAWDVASARVVEDAGAAAIATTSAGVAWSLGAADGDRLDRDRAIDLVARVAGAVAVPVTADIESGYADGPEGVAETVRGVLTAGAVGVNLEDGMHDGRTSLRPIGEQVERLGAARRAADSAGVPLFLNARVDIYLMSVGDPASRLRETLTRSAAYLGAGADGIFVPGVTDPELISVLTGAINAPLNVMAGPQAPPVADFASCGVARVSVGPSIAAAAYALTRHAAQELLSTGTYTTVANGLGYSELNRMPDGA